MYWLFATLFILLLYLIIRPLQYAYLQIQREAIERQELLGDEEFRQQMRERRYAPLHVLPTVRWEANFDTIEGSSQCFDMPTLVTAEDTGTFDCATICNDHRAGYFYVSAHDRFMVNGVLLARGGYCTTNSFPRRCNSETSLVLFSVNQWLCVAEDPRYFAGEGNIIQQAGRQHIMRTLPSTAEDNIVWDNMMNRVVNPTVNTFRRTWDDLLPDGRRRFEVRCNALDNRSNQMFPNPLNPIECLPNVCALAVGMHRDVRPDYERGVCDCGDINITRVRHVNPDDPSSQCAGIVDEADRANDAYRFRVPCLALDTPITDFVRHAFLCPDTFTANTDFAFAFTLTGVFPRSGNGIFEPTHRFYNDTKDRISWPTGNTSNSVIIEEIE
jgi:hypothetical protein